MFSDAHQIIATNERNRQMSWLGRPLDRVFYIFAAAERGRKIFMDLDIPGPVIMVADYEHRRSAAQARTFQDWVFGVSPCGLTNRCRQRGMAGPVPLRGSRWSVPRA